MTFWQTVSDFLYRILDMLGKFNKEDDLIDAGVEIKTNELGYKIADINLNEYKGKTIKGNINNGTYLPIYAHYYYKGENYTWLETQGYYDPLSGNCVTWFDISDIFEKNIEAIKSGEWKIDQ